MRESAFFTKLKPKLQDWGAYSRIENVVEQGTPDVLYCIDSQVGFIETKVEHQSRLFFELFQMNWYRRYMRDGGLTNIFVGAADQVGFGAKFYHASVIVAAPREKIKKWTAVRTEDLEPCLVLTRPYDWVKLRDLLSSPFTP